MLYKPTEHAHYHANFGVFISGQRQEFKEFTYYEEVQACTLHDEDNNPKERTHMHQPNNHAVHVHDHNVIWSDFFTNIGFGLSNKALTTTDGVYVDGGGGVGSRKLSFVLNGQTTKDIAGKVINDKDSLLVSYGSEDDGALQKQYEQIPRDTERIDKSTDPASCGGNEGHSLKDRLKATFSY